MECKGLIQCRNGTLHSIRRKHYLVVGGREPSTVRHCIAEILGEADASLNLVSILGPLSLFIFLFAIGSGIVVILCKVQRYLGCIPKQSTPTPNFSGPSTTKGRRKPSYNLGRQWESKGHEVGCMYLVIFFLN